MSLLSSSSSAISTTPKDDDISTAPKDDDISTKDDDISTATKDDDHFLIDLFNDFKDTISRAPHTIDNYFENIKIEIEVRIDSIVEELEKSNDATKEVLIEAYQKGRFVFWTSRQLLDDIRYIYFWRSWERMQTIYKVSYWEYLCQNNKPFEAGV